MGQIRLHKEHGLNPSVNTCFWCGEGKEVLLLGAAYKGEAPREMITNYDPCDKCAESYSQVVCIFEVQEREAGSNQLLIDEKRNLVPTGRMVGISEEAAERIMPDYGLKIGQKAFMDPQAFQMLFGEALEKMNG